MLYGAPHDLETEMTTTNDREGAAQLAQRIASSLVDPSKVDEAQRSPSDRPPGFADALMAEEPVPTQKGTDLSPADWRLIVKALEAYGTGRNA